MFYYDFQKLKIKLQQNKVILITRCHVVKLVAYYSVAKLQIYILFTKHQIDSKFKNKTCIFNFIHELYKFTLQN